MKNFNYFFMKHYPLSRMKGASVSEVLLSLSPLYLAFNVVGSNPADTKRKVEKKERKKERKKEIPDYMQMIYFDMII